MGKSYIKYTDGWKYQLSEDYVCLVTIKPEEDIVTEYIGLNKEGVLFIKEGYAWDGASGPAIDTKNFMRGSLVHDALYQLIRDKRIPADQRDKADRVLQKICEEDGMWKVRAWWVYKAVSAFGKDAAGKGGMHKFLYAPEAPKQETKKIEGGEA
jgi:hypothetical protein